MSGLPIKIIKIDNIRGLDVVFEVEYLLNSWVKKDGVNANLVLYDSPNFNSLIVFALVLV